MAYDLHGIFSTWTDQQIKILKELWKNGHSAKEISNRIWDDFQVQRSRSAVLGKIFRLKIARKTLDK